MMIIILIEMERKAFLLPERERLNEMATQILHIGFYIEGTEKKGFYAWQSEKSPKNEYGWGKTINKAISNLCLLLDGELDRPVECGQIPNQNNPSARPIDMVLDLIPERAKG